MSDIEMTQDHEIDHQGNLVLLKKGDTVTGKIVKIDEDEVFVDVGYKIDGVIPRDELSEYTIDPSASPLQIGDEVELKVLLVDDQKDKLILSKRVVDVEQAWVTIQQQFERNETILAKVVEVVKGGLVVHVGIRGFVPGSMVERTYVEDLSPYVGRTLRLKVKEIDREKNKVILSQKEILDEEFEKNKTILIQQIKAGQVFEGTVSRLTAFGAFVDIGGMDGLVHISELAWHHIKDPAEVVKVGEHLKVQVLKVDVATKKLSLSVKSLQVGPWANADKQFHAGDKLSGKVVRTTNFGAFVEIAQGIEGLVHISQITDRRIGHPSEIVKIGQTVQVKVLEIDITEKRISLTMKETDYDEPSNREHTKAVGKNAQPVLNNENIKIANDAMMTTLGERLGDKLKNLKL